MSLVGLTVLTLLTLLLIGIIYFSYDLRKAAKNTTETLHLPILLLSICDGRWGRYSAPTCGDSLAQRIKRQSIEHGVAQVLAHSENDIKNYKKTLPLSDAWERNWLDCAHVQKLLFILENRSLIETWPGIILYQDCKGGSLGDVHTKTTSRHDDLLKFLDLAGGFLVAHQPYKHKLYAPQTCSSHMKRDVTSPSYDTECQIRTSWMLFYPEKIKVFEEALQTLAHGHPACRTDGDALYAGKEPGRGDQTVIHNILFRDGLDKQLSAYDASGNMVNSVFFFEYYNPAWRVVLERAVC